MMYNYQYFSYYLSSYSPSLTEEYTVGLSSALCSPTWGDNVESSFLSKKITQLTRIIDYIEHLKYWPLKNHKEPGVLNSHFVENEKRKINWYVHVIPFTTIEKLLPICCGGSLFLLFSVFSLDAAVLVSFRVYKVKFGVDNNQPLVPTAVTGMRNNRKVVFI